MPLPDRSPILIRRLMCSKCGAELRPDFTFHQTGQLESMGFFCDNCKYGWEDQVVYSSGMMTKYRESPGVIPVSAKDGKPLKVN